MPTESDRVKFCGGCDTTLQWRATRCKACGKKQPDVSGEPPVQESVDFARTAAERESAASTTSGPQARRAEASVPSSRARGADLGHSGPVSPETTIDVDTIAVVAVAVLFFAGGVAVAWTKLLSTTYDSVSGKYVPVVSQGAVVGLVVCGSLLAATVAWVVIRAAVLSALRAHGVGRG